MNSPSEKRRKVLILSQTKLNLAMKILGTKSETETIEVALDSIISEAEKNKIAFEATKRFLTSGVEIKDVFGHLENKNDV